MTIGRASPSFSPLSTFSSCRSRAGTLSLPTIAAAKTGSVGLRTAPMRNASAQVSPTSK